MKYILQTDSERIEITIIRSRRRTLGLEVKGDGTVNARVPMRAPREIVERFIEEHKEWILKKRCEWGMNKAVDSSKILPAVGRKEGKHFNNRLLFVPEELVDYVVVHELAHRKEMNHSKAFWDVVEKYMPDYKERRAKLREYHIES